MKVRNVSANTVVIHDELSRSFDSQYQPGVKDITIASGEEAVVSSVYATTSPALNSLLAAGVLSITGSNDGVGGEAIPQGAATNTAWIGVVKTSRLESATPIYRIMFGTPGVGDEIVDASIYGYDVTTAGDVVVSADAVYNLSGTMTNAITTSAGTGQIIVTWTGSADTSQAGYIVFAKLGA